MRAVVQRVKKSSVSIGKERISEIGPGMLVLLGVAANDAPADAHYLADKLVHLRIFEDEKNKMNRSLIQTGGEMLVVSQFTLFGDCRKGRRPSFVMAAPSDQAETLYNDFVGYVRKMGVDVQTGVFKAMMDVSLINDGPVTIIIDSK